MPDPTRIPSAWQISGHGIAPQPMLLAHSASGFDAPSSWLTFRDLAAIQIAAAIKGTTRDLSPRETAEVAFDLAEALEDERARRQPRPGSGG
jgi:hypothetical protein